MKVLIPSALLSYTERSHVQARGHSLIAVIDDLERQYRGIRFRMIDEQGGMRPHVRFFVNGEQVFDLHCALHEADEIAIVQALSGG